MFVKNQTCGSPSLIPRAELQLLSQSWISALRPAAVHQGHNLCHINIPLELCGILTLSGLGDSHYNAHLWLSVVTKLTGIMKHILLQQKILVHWVNVSRNKIIFSISVWLLSSWCWAERVLECEWGQRWMWVVVVVVVTFLRIISKSRMNPKSRKSCSWAGKWAQWTKYMIFM